MYKLKKSFLFFCIGVLIVSTAKSQDIPILQMSLGAASNTSLLSNKLNNVGGYFSLEYLITRNIFVGVQADYLVAQNTIQLSNPSFSNEISFVGESLEMKENISKLNTGIYAGYKFFPLNALSFNVAASASNISLNRKFKKNDVLNEDAVNWYSNNWSENASTVFGVSASIDFYLNKTTMFRTGVNYQDITNALFDGKDQNLVKEISYTEGKISSMVLHKKEYQSMDVFIAFVFKLGIKKL